VDIVTRALRGKAPISVVVRVPTSFNAAALARLLEVLRTGAC